MNENLTGALHILTDKLEGWYTQMIAMLPNVVVAILMLILFNFLAKGARIFSHKILNRFSDKKAVNSLFSNTLSLLTIGIGLIVALNILHLEQTVTSLLAGAGIIGLALGFAFQDITANFISGVLIAIRKPIQVGDIIQTSSFMGTVEQIDLRVTIIRTFQGLHVIIPNKDVFQTPVTNYTKTYERRIDLEVGVTYGEDLEKVQEIALNAIEKMDFLLKGKSINVYFTDFGSSSINLIIMFWIHYPDEPGYLTARSEAIVAIKKSFDQNSITIPFPIRTLEIQKQEEEVLR